MYSYSTTVLNLALVLKGPGLAMQKYHLLSVLNYIIQY